MTVSSTEVALPRPLLRKVDELWEGAGPGLFDGTLLALVKVGRRALHCQRVPYRIWYAARQCEEIRRAMPHVALGVRGVTHSARRVLIGRRSQTVDLHPGCYELAPAGSLGLGADAWHQLCLEFREELGLGQEIMARATYLGMVRSVQAPVIDLCWRVTLKEAPCIAAGTEHSELFWLSIDAACELAEQKKCIPTTWNILRLAFDV